MAKRGRASQKTDAGEATASRVSHCERGAFRIQWTTEAEKRSGSARVWAVHKGEGNKKSPNGPFGNAGRNRCKNRVGCKGPALPSKGQHRAWDAREQNRQLHRRTRYPEPTSRPPAPTLPRRRLHSSQGSPRPLPPHTGIARGPKPCKTSCCGEPEELPKHVPHFRCPRTGSDSSPT